MFNFNSKSEKIYKFVYETKSSYYNNQKTMLLTASSPVQAVKMFNRKAGNELVNIVEFTELVTIVKEKS